ncbi:MAG: isoprenylcysteine carboxylmethyltransferase family protein [Kiritimatiellae bacterium]|nr:isoprenylcysteine carboxylmethyltransferase family protein [Kiritimatiellia bacterium]MCO5061119.1 isoprenylcysteine carboxylmethyltransferase family protein [Kiritimatiellia bacterium]MCO5067817.1 isoprenylcysteine carboxylmethyltransferase family protein [Kiritimatiellia bacterium]
MNPTTTPTTTNETPTRSIAARLRILLSRLLAAALLLPALFARSRWESYPLWEGVLFFLGTILVALAVVGRLWCSLYICGYKTNHLITEGPYSLSRNPLYVLSLIGAIGVGLTTETFTVPALIALSFAIYYPSVIRSEENILRARHPEEFARYSSEVPRFWPAPFRNLRETEIYPVKPRAFRKAMGSAVWFVILIGILELAESLREGGILPIEMNLW